MRHEQLSTLRSTTIPQTATQTEDSSLSVGPVSLAAPHQASSQPSGTPHRREMASAVSSVFSCAQSLSSFSSSPSSLSLPSLSSLSSLSGLSLSILLLAGCPVEGLPVTDAGNNANDDAGNADAGDIGDIDGGDPIDPNDAGDPDAGDVDAGIPVDAGNPNDGGVEPNDSGTPVDPDPVDVFAVGPYTVTPFSAEAGDAPLAPNAAVVFAPDTDAPVPLVILQHGFLLSNALYSELATHIASHGFLVVAPQMYNADGIPLGKPTAAEEAAAAREELTWAITHAADLGNVTLQDGAVAMVGHSRGGKVSWLVVKDGDARVKALVGIDPVDGQGGPFGGEARAVDDDLTYDLPTLVIGTGLGTESINAFSGACAPEGDNHEQFYGAAPAPAWHIVATEFGHLDMLNDDTSTCGFACNVCVDGPSREPMRTTTAGLTVAFLQFSLQNQESAADIIDGELPIAVSRESR